MGWLIATGLVLAVAIIGFIIPKAYSEKFEYEYGKPAINIGVSFICAAGIIFFLLNVDNDKRIWFWISLIVAVVLTLLTVLATYTNAKEAAGSTGIAWLAVIMQLLSVADVAITILTILALIFGDGSKKKKRR